MGGGGGGVLGSALKVMGDPEVAPTVNGGGQGSTPQVMGGSGERVNKKDPPPDPARLLTALCPVWVVPVGAGGDVAPPQLGGGTGAHRLLPRAGISLRILQFSPK